MRILYGANSQGQGHLSKAATLVPALEARGHEVRVVTSGPAPQGNYQFRWHRHFPGLAYEIVDGQTHFVRTAQAWGKGLPRLFRSLGHVKRLVQEFQPDLILSDFEPLTASPLLGAPCEVVCVSRQVSLFDHKIALPEGFALERKFTRTVIRLFTAGADRLYGYHYEPASYRCLPLVVRSELALLRPETGEHVLAYCHSEEPETLINWARSRRIPVRAYGFPAMPRGQQGLVTFLPPGRQTLLEDLRTARGVITNAGLTTPIEAFLLGKPTLVIPIRRQWEQLVNATQLELAGLATASSEFLPDRLLDAAPPSATHPLQSWLRTKPDRILDVLLGESRHAQTPVIAQPTFLSESLGKQAA